MSPSSSPAIERAIRRAPPFPAVARAVLRTVAEPDWSVKELAGVIRQDPSLTARLLKLCNSSLYARTDAIEQVDEAMAWLGSANVVRVVVATCTKETFQAFAADSELTTETIRRRALACGIAAESLRARSGIPMREGTAFTAGILHELGSIVIAQSAITPDVAPRAAHETRCEHERRVFGIDHAGIAARFAEHWSLPHTIHRALSHHHDAVHIASDPELTATLHLADALARQLDGDLWDTDPPLREALARLGLDEKALAETVADVRDDLMRFDRELEQT